MCLTPEQVHAITQATHDLLRPKARVRLFGPRLDDSVKRGDIDLLRQSPEPVDKRLRLAAQRSARMKRRLGQRRVSVLLVNPSTTLQPVHLDALRSGRLLN